MSSKTLPIEEIFSLVPLPFLVIFNIDAVLSVLNNPWGHTKINLVVWEIGIHSLTIIYLSFFYLVLYFHFYSELRPLYKMTFSAVPPLFGLFFYEFWWHLGCRITIGGGIPKFWFFYVWIVFICIIALHMNYRILDFSKLNLIKLGVFFTVFLLFWVGTIRSGFYPKLLLHGRGLAEDPHGPLNALSKGASMLMWLMIVNKVTINE